MSRNALAPLAALVLGGLLAPPAQAQIIVYRRAVFGDAAFLVNAQANLARALIVGPAEARLLRAEAAIREQEAIDKRLDNKRKAQKQWLWERENLPTREEAQLENWVRHSRNASRTEIWSGLALNNLLDDLKKNLPQIETELAPETLPEDLLKKINVTSGKYDGNIGLFKNEKIFWPQVLMRPLFQADRDKLDGLVKKARAQAQVQTRVDPEILEEMLKTFKNMEFTLKDTAKERGDKADWTPPMYIDALQCLRNFYDAFKVLQQEDAANYLNGKYEARGKTVADFVRHMRDAGLRVAPTTSDAQNAAYTALHSYLAAYQEKVAKIITDRKRSERQE